MLGLMWFTDQFHDGSIHIRHTCEQNDKLPRYGWIRHDGVNFGMQEIVDHGYTLSTDFVKRSGGDNGGDWSARVTGQLMENWGRQVRSRGDLYLKCLYQGQGNNFFR